MTTTTRPGTRAWAFDVTPSTPAPPRPRPATRPWAFAPTADTPTATDRPESAPCQRGTCGCSVDHAAPGDFPCMGR